MTTDVVTVAPDTPVRRIATLLLDRRISAVPVIDAEHRVVGIVSEADLMHRTETGTAGVRPRWLELFSDAGDLAREFVRSHGPRAEDVMTRGVASVSEDTHVTAMVRLFRSRRIKRAPVLRDGKLVGIVSRADLLRGFAGDSAQDATVDDGTIRQTILTRLRAAAWAKRPMINVVVEDGTVELHGFAESDEQKRAIRALAESVAGTHAVRDQLRILPRQIYAA
jgi:CBS-domain-containing membrane protein